MVRTRKARRGAGAVGDPPAGPPTVTPLAAGNQRWWRRAYGWLGGVRWLPVVSLVTPFGFTVLLGSVAAWVVAATVGWIELLLGATTGLLAVGLCGLFVVTRARPRVELEPTPRRVVEGSTPALVDVRVWNESASPMAPLDLEVTVGKGVETFTLPRIAGHGMWRNSFTVPATRRGVVPIGPAATSRSDPLGLLDRRVAFTDISSLYVHPATVRLAPLGTGLLRDLEGRATNELSMSDLAFHTLREYTPGDDRRYIHWRSSAKVLTSGGSLLVRQFQDTRRTQLLVVVDGDRSAYRDPEQFEVAIRVGASVAVRAVEDEIDVTLLVADRKVVRRAGRRVTKQVALDACALAGPTDRPLASLVGDGVNQARDLTYAVVVTGAGRTVEQARKAASRVPRHVRTLLLHVNPDGRKGVVPGASISVLTVTQLSDLPGLMGKGDRT